MPNSYYGDKLKLFKPERIDIYGVPYGYFIAVTGSGIGCVFTDKTEKFYSSNLYLSGHHQPVTGFLGYGSGDSSPYGCYLENYGTSGNPAEYYYYNNKLYYTGEFPAIHDGTLRFKTHYSEKNILMSEMTSGAITEIETMIFTGNGTITGFQLIGPGWPVAATWTGNRAPKSEAFLEVNVSNLPAAGFPFGDSRQMDPVEDYLVNLDANDGTTYLNFYHPPPNGYRISVKNLMVV
jgi:hypothetical protein